MFDLQKFESSLFSISTASFQEAALEVFCYQWQHNTVYRQFCISLHKNPSNVNQLEQIPFLPIEFFKTCEIKTGAWEVEKIFLSSGTTAQARSRHFVKSESLYHKISKYIFEERYGPLHQLEILALLPNYLEQEGSSLISMVDHFIRNAAPGSAFLLNDHETLKQRLYKKTTTQRLLIGITYALLDLAENVPASIHGCTIIETGGMKGRGRELTRPELHSVLERAFEVNSIHSEYGMTELFSQAYGSAGLFTFPQWCRVLIRDINDPFSYLSPEKTGGINVIDLANIHTCSFIETKDLGRTKTSENSVFEVLGRFDNSDLRGCNLLV